jgi:O-antigen ligase
MIKAILYLGLTSVAILATFVNPFIGVIACIEAYLMYPTAISMNDGQFHYQFWTSIAFILSYLIYRPQPLLKAGPENWIMRCLWAFVAIGLASALWATVSASIAVNSFYEVIKTIAIVALFVRVIRSEKEISVVLIACIVGVMHASFMHVFGPRLGYVSAALGRGDGVLTDPQNGVLMLFVPLIVLLAMFGGRKEKILCWCALPLVLDSMVNTYERTGFTALLVEFPLMLAFLPRRQKAQLIPIMVFGFALLLFRFTPADYWQKMATIATPHEEASAASRFVVNDASWRMFLDYPMGVGYRNYPYTSPRYLAPEYLTESAEGVPVRSAHNSYFSVLCETGFIGFAIWIASFGGTILILRSIRKSAGPKMGRLGIYATALEIGLYGWAVGSWVQDYQEVDPAYWFAGFAVVLYRLSSLQHKDGSLDKQDGLESRELSVVC